MCIRASNWRPETWPLWKYFNLSTKINIQLSASSLCGCFKLLSIIQIIQLLSIRINIMHSKFQIYFKEKTLANQVSNSIILWHVGCTLKPRLLSVNSLHLRSFFKWGLFSKFQYVIFDTMIYYLLIVFMHLKFRKKILRAS